MKITDVSIFRVSGHWSGPVFPPGDRQSRQTDIYPEFNKQPLEPALRTGDPLQALYVQIDTDEGIAGLFGPLQESQSYPIYKSLRPFLLGRDPLATELLQDQMLRLDRHGRSGIFMTALSPIDIALWDLKGKAWGQPIYRLLGGPTRTSIPAYASLLGFSVEPKEAAKVALEYKAMGYPAQKWFFRHGPGSGSEGFSKNLSMAEAVRGALGPHYPLMFDAFMGWDKSYSSAMLKALAPLQPTWMEEPIPPERVGELHRLHEESSIPIATGEHVYTRWQTQELLVRGAVDVLQNDTDWTGGITEQVKVCALASSFGVPVITHGHSLLPALHIAGSQSPSVVPYVEYLVRFQHLIQYFHESIYEPKNGFLSLPTLPGLGFKWDEQKVEKREKVTF